MTRQDAIKWLSNLKMDIGKTQHQELWHYEQAIDEIIEVLENSQNCVKCAHYYETEDECGVHSHCEQEPRRGKWVKIYPKMLSIEDQRFYGEENPKEPIPDKRFPILVCSLCGTTHPGYEDNFCPNCGARMEVEEC